jgi:hypothetical protein
MVVDSCGSHAVSGSHETPLDIALASLMVDCQPDESMPAALSTSCAILKSVAFLGKSTGTLGGAEIGTSESIATGGVDEPVPDADPSDEDPPVEDPPVEDPPVEDPCEY